ncbi:FecR family protein [Draconibacterium halophilum]|uniref:FecR family protein n=1 Tax=Draconibacterium halophilum TaxID=2706887 RepID=A0A6C0RJ14_9BACT|nr:FecR family protein [Draconibacterium halophilum]QIA09151.1 FecR family protein [Draconibacterium halophilum]
MFWIKKEQLNADVKHNLWLTIREFNKTLKKESKSIQLKLIARYAASVLIIISLSSILYLSFFNQGDEYIFSEANIKGNTENTMLTLANGQKIEVKKEQSNITVLKNEGVVIDETLHDYESVASSSNKELPLNELVIPFGKKAELVLSDGTKVWLNAGTRFAFPQEFIGKKRKVFLDGEGYFEVAKNAKKPFIVSSRNMNVEVLGTKFNMSSYSSDDLCETVLLEGSVNVWNDNKFLKDKVQMMPNQKATFNTLEKEIKVVAEPDAQNYIAWVEGLYKFKNENLEQVLTKIGRYYNMSFFYDSDKIKSALPISGKLDLQDSFEEVMLTLSKVAQIEYKIEGQNVIIN